MKSVHKNMQHPNTDERVIDRALADHEINYRYEDAYRPLPHSLNRSKDLITNW